MGTESDLISYALIASISR